MDLLTVSARVRIGSRIVGSAAFLAACGAVGTARATQFVVADATYTHSAQTTTDSHYRVNPSSGTPTNWTSPVDYATGSAHVRLEVKTKPNTTTQTCFQVCFEATQNYGCTDISKPYTTTGVYEWDTPFSRFYTPGPVPWERGILKVALLLKDTKNVKPAPENVGAATSALYMPTDVRVTVTIVSSGSTFEPPAGTPVADAGAVDSGRVVAADGGAADAAAGSRDSGLTGPDAGSSVPPGVPDAGLADDGGGLVQPPGPPTGQGGSAGTSTPPVPPPASRDASSPGTNPTPAGQDASASGTGGQGGPRGTPSGGRGVAGGCLVSGGAVPTNVRGLAWGLALALAAALRRRRRRH